MTWTKKPTFIKPSSQLVLLNLQLNNLRSGQAQSTAPLISLPLLMNNATVSASAVEISPETRPAESDASGGPRPTIKIIVSYGSSLHELHLHPESTFGDVKKLLVNKTGLEPEEQRLFFRGIEKGDNQHLHLEGVKDKSKILLLEVTASKERKFEETQKQNEMSKAFEAIAAVRAEVDKLSNRVTAIEVAINGGNKAPEKEFLVLTELLMSQLLKLDGIEAEGEAKLQRKAEVRRVQNLVDKLDSLKARNSNPFSDSSNAAVKVTTQWETFESGMESSDAPSDKSSSTKVTQDWERFD